MRIYNGEVIKIFEEKEEAVREYIKNCRAGKVLIKLESEDKSNKKVKKTLQKRLDNSSLLCYNLSKREGKSDEN